MQVAVFAGQDFEGDVGRDVAERARHIEGEAPLPFPSDGDSDVEMTESRQDGLGLEGTDRGVRRPLAPESQVGRDRGEVVLAAAVGGRDGLNEDCEYQEAGLGFRGPYGHGDVVAALLLTLNEHSAVGR